MKSLRIIFGTLALCMAFAAVSSAGSLTINFSNGTNYIVNPSLTGFATYGDGMAGMSVTAYFGATTASAVWTAAGVGSGSALAPGVFSLAESGDTFSSNWTLTDLSGNSLTRIVLFGPPGLTVFDRCLVAPCSTDTSLGTPGSALGWTFAPTGGTFNGNINVLYTDIVSIVGSNPVGDLYATLDVSFGSGFTGNSTLLFRQDTDSAASNGSIIPTTVPEPASLLLVGSGVLLGALALRRRR